MRENEMNDLDAIAKLMELLPPKGIGVIPQTTPVISFGDFTKARVATLGINPSSREFLSGGKLIQGSKKRLVDFEVLGSEAQFPMTSDQASQVWDGCTEYFNTNNTYWSWFKPLAELLQATAGLSYHDGSACHLDLSPWATDPVWGKLSKEQKQVLINDGLELLNWQTQQNQLDAIIFNGRQVYEVIKEFTKIEIKEIEPFRYEAGGRELTSELVVGVGPLGQKVLGWTLNLQNVRASALEKQMIKTDLCLWLRKKMYAEQELR